MAIITFAKTKGGVGSTTLCFNFAEELAGQGKKVLLIDNDYEPSLTLLYDIFRKSGSVAEIYKDDDDKNKVEPEIISLKENLCIIPSGKELEKVAKQLESRTNKEKIFSKWYYENYDKLQKFDHIIIDNHPDFSTLTQNTIVLSDVVFSPIEPRKMSYLDAKTRLEIQMENFKKNMLDPRSGESYVEAKLYFLANMLKHNTNSSRNLREIANSDESIIVNIPHKELFATTTDKKKALTELRKDREIYLKNRKFFEEMQQIFNQLTKIVDNY